jgi:hypothetical protein
MEEQIEPPAPEELEEILEKLEEAIQEAKQPVALSEED